MSRLFAFPLPSPMAVQLNVSADVRGAVRFLDDVVRSQVPFATAKALDATVKQGQRAQLELMARAFTIRRSAFLRQSVKITQFPTKREPTARIAIADVGGKPTADEFGKFEAGGVKVPHEGIRAFGQRLLAVPRTGSIVRPRKASVTLESLRAGVLLRNEGALSVRAFLRRTKAGGAAIMAVDRVHEARLGVKRRGGARGGKVDERRARPTVLYFLEPHVPIDARLGLAATIRAAVASGFRPNFDVALAEALRTRR